mgnify:CR=1 FL=1
MKIFKKMLMLLAVLMMVVTPFAAITADTTSSSSSTDTAKTTDDSLKKVKEKGTLVVGLSADYPPYEFTTKQDGKTEYVGIDIHAPKLRKKMEFPSFFPIFLSLRTSFLNFSIRNIYN